MHMVRNSSGSTHPGRCPYEYATDAECWIPPFEGISIPSPPTRVHRDDPTNAIVNGAPKGVCLEVQASSGRMRLK